MDIKLYSSAAELEEVREFWTNNQENPNSDFEHFLLVCQMRTNVLNPCIISLSQAAQCRCLVVARRERVQVQASIGYLRISGIWATAITVVRGGVIGTLDLFGAAQVVGELDRLLRQGYADLVTVNFIREGEPLWQALSARPAGLLAQHTGSMNHRGLSLQPETGFLLKGMRSKHRYWIKRKERSSRKRFLIECSGAGIAQIADLPALCRQIEQVAQATYQRGLGAGFVDDNETRARLEIFARRSQLRALLLKIDGKPKAFWLGEIYRGVFHSSATGYLPEFRGFEVGTLVFLRMVDELVQEGVNRIDFGLGDAQYKERFGDCVWRESTIKLFAPTMKSFLLAAMLRTSAFVDRTLRKLVGWLGVTDQIKQRWRKHFKAKVTPQGPTPAE